MLGVEYYLLFYSVVFLSVMLIVVYVWLSRTHSRIENRQLKILFGVNLLLNHAGFTQDELDRMWDEATGSATE